MFLFRINADMIEMMNPIMNTVRNIKKNCAAGLLNISFSSAICEWMKDAKFLKHLIQPGAGWYHDLHRANNQGVPERF